MLSQSNRLTSAAQFREVVRRGRRCGGPLMVVHLEVEPGERAGSGLPAHRDPGRPRAPRAGFVVSRAVGPAVTRNLVKRRLRHLVRERLAGLPSRGMLVVRALPAAADASYTELGAELDRCLDKMGRSARSSAPAGVSR